MLSSKLFAFGKLSGVIYDFPEVGDELELHEHGEEDNHITVVARGSFRLLGEYGNRILKAGAVVDWPVGKRHGFVALEPNSRLVNVIK